MSRVVRKHLERRRHVFSSARLYSIETIIQMRSCCYSSVGAFSSSFELLYNSDSHHWCFHASASARFGEPAVSHIDTSQSCAGTANQEQCTNFACIAGYTVVSAPTCSSGNWNGEESAHRTNAVLFRLI